MDGGEQVWSRNAVKQYGIVMIHNLKVDLFDTWKEVGELGESCKPPFIKCFCLFPDMDSEFRPMHRKRVQSTLHDNQTSQKCMRMRVSSLCYRHSANKILRCHGFILLPFNDEVLLNILSNMVVQHDCLGDVF